MQVGLSRRNIGRLVLLAWAVALAWLFRRQFTEPESAATASRASRIAPSAQYFAIYAGARQIGQLNLTVDTLVDGVRITELAVIDLPRGDSTDQLAQGSEYALSRSLRLRSFTRTVFGVGRREQLEGEYGTDSVLRVRDIEAPATSGPRVAMRVSSEAVLPAMLPLLATFGGNLDVGKRFTLLQLDLGTSATRPLDVTVTAESTFVVPDSAVFDPAAGRWVAATTDTIRAWRVEHDAPGAPTVSWVDATGAIVHQETAGGLTLVRSAFEIVRNNYRASRNDEASGWRRRIPGMVELTATRERPEVSEPARMFLLRPDSGATVSGNPAGLAGGRQQVHGDTLIITRETARDSSPGNERDARVNGTGPTWNTPLLDGALSFARRAIGGALTLRDSAARLTAWVAQEIATDTTTDAPGTAPSALRSRRGNADGKARVLAALARQSGIPARVVSGVAVVGGGEYGHAWTELWLGGWTAADPTYGQFPASASLVRLAIGERSHAMDLLPLTASARFLPIRKGP